MTEAGKLLRETRERKNLSLQHVATKAGISISTLQRIEAGKKSVEAGNIAAVSAVLGLAFDWDSRRITPQKMFRWPSRVAEYELAGASYPCNS